MRVVAITRLPIRCDSHSAFLSLDVGGGHYKQQFKTKPRTARIPRRLESVPRSIGRAYLKGSFLAVTKGITIHAGKPKPEPTAAGKRKTADKADRNAAVKERSRLLMEGAFAGW